MRLLLTILPLLLASACTQAQEPTRKLVGGPCEGCEAVFEYPDEPLSATVKLPEYGRAPKIKITGTVYLPDGKTPADGVILYVYHTDETGLYPTKGNETGWARRHGYIRAWVQTDADGRFAFYSFKPAQYPSRVAPAHIHVTILEPDGKYYWIDEYLFSGDPLIPKTELTKKNPRGGQSGILKLTEVGDHLEGKRDIILGANIPGY